MKESVTSRLKIAMSMRGLKQVDLVERTGLTKSAISQYCSGKFQPKQQAVFLLAKALDVNEAWLMGHDLEMEKIIVSKLDKNAFDAFEILDDKIFVQLSKNEKIGLSLLMTDTNKLIIEIKKE